MLFRHKAPIYADADRVCNRMCMRAAALAYGGTDRVDGARIGYLNDIKHKRRCRSKRICRTSIVYNPAETQAVVDISVIFRDTASLAAATRLCTSWCCPSVRDLPEVHFH